MGMHGKKHSPETIARMRTSALARKYSEEGAKAHREAKMGANNPQWRGGRVLSGNGYVMIRMPGHPMADRDGYVREHRLVMAEHLGRTLDPREHVHHRNEDRQDNRIANLELMGIGEHIAHHHTGAKRSAETCARIGAAKIGNRNRLGKRHSEETKAKIRAAKIGRKREG
jgi:hypothetical protein